MSASRIYCGRLFSAAQAARRTASHAVDPVAYPLALSIGEPWKLAALTAGASMFHVGHNVCFVATYYVECSTFSTSSIRSEGRPILGPYLVLRVNMGTGNTGEVKLKVYGIRKPDERATTVSDRGH